ncbi:MAG: response regulator [Desulfobacterales bacterium]|nr:response regulator [Desulfobacterales bacterium]
MNILLADDDQVTLRLLEKHIQSWDHNVFAAQNGLDAWDIASTTELDLVITDWNMPGLDGLELCQRIRNADLPGYVYLIIVSAKDSNQDIVTGLRGGIDDYITKPFDFNVLQERIETGARIVTLERKLRSKYDIIEKNYYQTIRMFSNLIEVFNEDLGGHCRRVAKTALKMAKRHPQLDENDYPLIEAGGLLHDIGMVGFPNHMLFKKTTELAGDEMRLYKSHPVQGEIIVKEIEFLRPLSKIIRSHHEQVNGRGFPDGLSDEQIPLPVKIISTASAYDSLIHKWRFSFEEVPERLMLQKGYQLDPEIVDLVLEINVENMRAEIKRNSTKVSLENIAEGMVLAENIRRNTGTLLMPVETVITAATLEKILKYSELGTIGNTVMVYKESVRK